MDYFAILGVQWNATSEEIKRAFREKVRRFHPDVSSAPDAAERFREVVEAYNVLGDDERRRQYIQKHVLPYIKPPSRTSNSYANASPWHRRQQRMRHAPSIQTLHVGFLIVGLLLLGSVLSGLWQTVSVALAAQPTTCTTISWERNGTHYRLNYEATVPWQTVPQQNSRLFDDKDDSYVPGRAFRCYYNEAWTATQLWRFDTGYLFNITPWGLFGGLLVWKAIRHFFSR